MSPGKTSDGVLPGLFSGTRDARVDAVRDYNEEDPGKPRPVRAERHRRTTDTEAAEADPWAHLRRDGERDHKHVC